MVFVMHVYTVKKKKKVVMGKIAQSFNAKPKRILKLLKDAGVLSDAMSEIKQATIISEFLRYTPLLKKVAVGQYLASGDSSFDVAVRTKYIHLFNLNNKSMLAALRTFLEAFRLPGEAQQIDRLLQAFANETYMNSADAPLMATADVAYLLSFSIIMLNTDLHNPNIKSENKMSLSDFIKQNKNYGPEVSAGKDLPVDFLVGIYNSIKTNEIRKFDEDDDGFLLNSITDNMWSDFLSRGEKDLQIRLIDGGRAYLNLTHLSQTRKLTAQLNATRFDSDVFSLVWGSTVNALSVTFDTVTEGKIMDLALDGFILMTKIAAAYQMCSVFDSIVCTLLRFSTWAEENVQSMKNKTCNDASINGSKNLTSESHDAAIKIFGSNHKAQMATVAVFGVVRKFGSSLREGWLSVLQCMIRIGVVGLLPQMLANSTPDGISTEISQKHFVSVAYSNQFTKMNEVVDTKQNSNFFHGYLVQKNILLSILVIYF